MSNDTFKIPVTLKQLITSNQAFHYRAVPISHDGETIHFKTDSEHIESLQQELSIILNQKIVLIPET